MYLTTPGFRGKTGEKGQISVGETAKERLGENPQAFSMRIQRDD